MATLKLNNTTVFTETNGAASIPSGVTIGNGVNFPAGHVLQVLSTTVTDRASSTDVDASGLGADVGLNVTIIPKSSNSKFYVIVNVGLGTTTGGNSWAIILSRDGVRVGNGASTGVHYGVLFRSVDHAGSTGTDTNHGVGGSGSYTDETSGITGTPITYKAGLTSEGGTSYINRVESDYAGGTTSVAAAYAQSTITVMEIQK